MNKYFELSRAEKRVEWFLLIIFVCWIIILFTGIFSEVYHNSQNDILLQLLLANKILPIVFFLTLGFNGVSGGNLVPKFTPRWLYQLILFLIKAIFPMTEKLNTLTIKSIGIIYFIICGILILSNPSFLVSR